MSKNTNIADLINYISVDGSGNVVLSTGQLVATQNYVTTAVSNLVASAPSTLDTLNELATALGNDANFATTVTTSIATKQPQLNGTGFVKVSGTTVSYDNSTYLTSITSGNVTTALGFTPYNSTNPSGYISSYTETDPTVSATAKKIIDSAWAGTSGYPGYSFTGGNSRFGFSSSTGIIDIYADGNFYATDSSHLVLHAGNYGSYAVPLGGGAMTGQLQINTPSNGVGSAFQLYSTAYHQYLSIYSNGSYEAMVNYRNTTTQWYAGLRTSAQLVGTDGFHFYNNSQAQTVAGFTSSGTIYGIGNINVNGEGNFGPNSGGDNGIRIRYGNGGAGYGRIRFMQDGTNHSTIHSFAANWQGGSFIGASAGAINIDGQYGTTFGGWDAPYAHVNSDALYIQAWATPVSSTGWNANSVLRLQHSSTGDNVYIEMRNRADIGDHAAILFTDNNVGGYIGFRTYASNNLAAGSDCMIYGSYNDHIFQSGSSGVFNDKGETFRVYANGNYRFIGSNVSDRRLKKDIKDLNFGLNEIIKLYPKSYNLKLGNNQLKKNYGFIAQEIQDILPEIVTGVETETEYLGLDYNSILAIAVKAIQELKAENDELREILNRNNII